MVRAVYLVSPLSCGTVWTRHTALYLLDYADDASSILGESRGAAKPEYTNHRRLVGSISSMKEQHAIVEWIADETIMFRLVAGRNAEREIALLREYRTRLIADVVTGKLDVREAATNYLTKAEDG